MDDLYYRKIRPKHTLSNSIKKIFRNRNVLIGLLIIIPAFSFILFSNRGIIKHFSLVAEKHRMEEKILEAQREQQRLKDQSNALDHDPKAIEKVAREKYGMIKEGETVYKVKKK